MLVSFPLGVFPRIQWLYSMVDLFSELRHLYIILHSWLQTVCGELFSIPCQHICLFNFWIIVSLTWRRWNFIVIFLWCPEGLWSWTSFRVCLLLIYTSSFETMHVCILCSFLNCVVLLQFLGLLINSCVLIFDRYIAWKWFLPKRLVTSLLYWVLPLLYI